MTASIRDNAGIEAVVHDTIDTRDIAPRDVLFLFGDLVVVTSVYHRSDGTIEIDADNVDRSQYRRCFSTVAGRRLERYGVLVKQGAA